MSEQQGGPKRNRKGRGKRSKGRDNWDDFVAEHSEDESDFADDDLVNRKKFRNSFEEYNRGKKGKRGGRKNREQGMDGKAWEELAPTEKELERQERQQFDSMDEASGKWAWMKERRFKKMFEEIESGLQNVMGTGSYDWVDRRVFDQVFDRLTLMSIYKLMKAGTIDTVEWPIARGKEAHVFRGEDENGPIAVKIFHTGNAVFKNLLKYIEGDPRFSGLKRKHRDLVTIWVRKEHRNLLRMRRVGLAVPEPLGVLNNVLVMQYLGGENAPSPRIRDVEIEDPKSVFDQLVYFLAGCWQNAGLVHGDFSPYNILWHEGIPLVIDVGQSVALAHPHSQEFLVRDIERLVTWAKANGIEASVAEILYDVINTPPEELVSPEMLERIHSFSKFDEEE